MIAFYSRMPSEETGLDFLSGYYVDSASDVQQAAKILFKAKVDAMTEEEIGDVVTAHQNDCALYCLERCARWSTLTRSTQQSDR